MSIDPRNPVIVGVGEITRRGHDITDPIDLAVEAAMRAAADVGRPVLDRIDVVATPGILMIPRDNPATRVAEAISIKPRRRISCPVGGNTPQYLVEVLGAEIAVGRADCVLVVGAESGHSARNVNGRNAIAAPSPCEARDEALGDARPGLSDVETSAGLRWPHEVYPMFESAIAARHGRDFSTQRDWLGALMAPFTQEAARHPEQAWFAQARTASELSDVRPNNRMVCEPYPKLLNSIITVDMGAAFLMVAAEVADKLGVPRDRWVFPWAAASCNDVFYPVQRPDLNRSPGIRAAARHVLARSGVAVDDITWLDLYSCFPSAVQIAIDELDLDPADARGFTVTGGLPYHGGPGNNYVTHSIVEMVRRCRHQPRGLGLISGLGWFMTKHSIGLWSATPPPTGWRTLSTAEDQAEIDASQLPVVTGEEANGAATIDAYTVVYARSGDPAWTPVIAHLADGRRVAARSDDPDVAAAMCTEMFVGRKVSLRQSGPATTFEPA